MAYFFLGYSKRMDFEGLSSWPEIRDIPNSGVMLTGPKRSIHVYTTYKMKSLTHVAVAEL